ncbi:hypothetical protein I308_100217 [Cryptococcus tetragattii IND107]|uniref:Uncharacterized protein n=1 Tax=Cryptococcus tetragattii IND107 TaxID=1296105 RepID=A0ABR3C454_9TREE|nr:hypothetical protein I308_04544 [Cryptococcus tetragattii IND107]
MSGIPVFVAILIGLACSFVQSLGLTIQRKSHIQEDLLPLSARRPAIRRPLWLIGFIIYMTSNVFATFFQLDALPIVILAPLGAVSLVFNALFAHMLLGDKFGMSWVIGTALVAGGAVMIAVFGVVPDEEHGLDELLLLLKRGPFVAFFTIVLTAVAAVLAVAHIASWHAHRHQSNQITLSGASTPVSVPSNYASPRSTVAIPFRPRNARHRSSSNSDDHEDEYTKPTVEDNDNPRLASKNPSAQKSRSLSVPHYIHEVSPKPIAESSHTRTLTLCGLAFAAAAGTLSGLCLVLAKATVELFMKTIDHWRTGAGRNEFARPQTWVLMLGMNIIAVAQVWYLHHSLKFTGPALVCPLAFCFFNLSSIFDGLIFYNQFRQLATYQILLVSFGTAILLLGVWIVSAIQPEGNVEVGTWVEEDMISDRTSISSHESRDELEAGEGATLLGRGFTVEPQDDDSHWPLPHHDIGTAFLRDQPVFAPSPSSPHSPMSPRFFHSRSHSSSHAHHHRHKGPRYGSLLHDIGSHGAPMGFSIGLGAASPGFVLRSGSMSEHHHHGEGERNRRRRSEGPLGLGAIIHGDDNSALQTDVEEGHGENATEAALRDWDTSERRTNNWWDVRRLFASQGNIRLTK